MNNKPIEFSEIKNSINAQYYIDLIYDEKWEKMEMWDITETTFTYLHTPEFNDIINDMQEISYEDYIAQIHFNKHYFSSVWWIDFSKWLELDSENQQIALIEAKEKILKIFTDKIQQIELIQEELTQKWKELNLQLQWLDSESKQYKKIELEFIKLDMLIRSIWETKPKLEQAKISVIFEAEKAWLPHNLSEDEVRQLCKQLDEYDNILHGGSIVDDSPHMQRCYRVMQTEYNDFLENNDDSKIISNTLSQIKSKLSADYVFERYELPQKDILTFMDEKINTEKIVEDYNTICSIAQMNYPVYIADVSTITNTDSWLKFPRSIKEKSREESIRKAGHEIICHTTTLLNGNKLLWFKWASYVDKEEWMAVLKELLFVYGKNMYCVDSHGNMHIDINKIDIMHDPKMLAWEILSWEEYFNFLANYHEVKSDRFHSAKRFERFKRWRPFYIPGTQKKDRSYINWLWKIINFINNWGNVHDLELAKHGLADLDNVKKIHKNLCDLWEEPDLIKLNGLDEFIYFREAVRHLKWEYNKTEKHNTFSEYLKERGLEIYTGTFRDFFQDKYPMFDISWESLINIPLDLKESDKILKQVANILSKPKK